MSLVRRGRCQHLLFDLCSPDSPSCYVSPACSQSRGGVGGCLPSELQPRLWALQLLWSSAGLQAHRGSQGSAWPLASNQGGGGTLVIWGELWG